MLNSHNDIRFIIIDYGFTRKIVYKHSISNNNVHVPVYLSKYISFIKNQLKLNCIDALNTGKTAFLKQWWQHHM